MKTKDEIIRKYMLLLHRELKANGYSGSITIEFDDVAERPNNNQQHSECQ